MRLKFGSHKWIEIWKFYSSIIKMRNLILKPKTFPRKSIRNLSIIPNYTAWKLSYASRVCLFHLMMKFFRFSFIILRGSFVIFLFHKFYFFLFSSSLFSVLFLFHLKQYFWHLLHNLSCFASIFMYFGSIRLFSELLLLLLLSLIYSFNKLNCKWPSHSLRAHIK